MYKNEKLITLNIFAILIILSCLHSNWFRYQKKRTFEEEILRETGEVNTSSPLLKRGMFKQLDEKVESNNFDGTPLNPSQN